jgi:hypothetical protein
MTTTQFLNYIRYTTTRPERINAARWVGMIRWAITHGHLAVQKQGIYFWKISE